MNVIQKHVTRPPLMDSRQASDLDYDMLVTHVENTISKDKQSQFTAMTPQELLLRSNPGLFSMESLPTSGDLTNPREMYNILSNKTKSIEDLEAKFKKELVKSVQSTGSFPKLSRTLSMNDIDNRPGRGFGHRQLNMLVLNRNNTSLAVGLRKVKESDDEYESAVNLPNIETMANTKGANQKSKEQYKGDKNGLPNLAQTNGTVQKNTDTQQYKIVDSKTDVAPTEKAHVSFSDSKLEKWFSEMPSEVFDKAQRALMEESVQERLHEFKRKRSRKTNFPNQSFNLYIGSKNRKVPNTYLELRVDSFGKHLMETDDKKNRYRLHQKSIHNLKMRESSELDLHERMHREETFPRLSQNRSSKTCSKKQKNKSEAEVLSSKTKKDAAKVSTDGGIKTLYINERFDKEIGQVVGQKHAINNYEDYTEKLMALKEMQYHDLLKTLAHSPPNSQYDPDEVRFGDIDFERENTKATIVNLELRKETPNSRTPYHLEKSLTEASKTNALFQKDTGITEEAIKQMEENMETSIQQELTHGKIITKIPTAPSIRTSESRSSTSSFKTNKEAMKKFNTLEVFAEGGNKTQAGNATEGASRHLRHAFPKTDTKNQQVQHETENENMIKEVKKPENDFVFRFEPGEVFITRKNPNKTLTHTVSSDRARVIYGKVVNSAMGKKGGNKYVNKKDFKDNNSIKTKTTTKLDFYRAEVGKYESRALDDCLTDITPRQDKEPDPLLVITSKKLRDKNQQEHGSTHGNDMNLNKSNGIANKRDVATETDIIGSAKEDEAHFYRPPPSDRSLSGLSDFIIDNNDGESLNDSESDDNDDSSDIRDKANQSV